MKDIEWPIEILQNKYARWYEQIVLRAQQRTLPKDTYIEKHHIIPRSLGGDNSATNLAKLTAREHFICHWLLTKMWLKGSKEWSKMINALNGMRAGGKNHGRYYSKITSRVFENIRIYISENRKGKKHSKETCLKMSKSKKGKPSPHKGKTYSKEIRYRMGKANLKLDDIQAIEIRSKYASKEYSPSSLAEDYKVGYKVISNIITNKTFKHLLTEKELSNSLNKKHHANLKFNDAQAIEIQNKYIPRKYTIARLAEEYNVARMTIHRIIKNQNKSFKHLSLGEIK